MVADNLPSDEILASLALPLRNIGIDQVCNPHELMNGQLFGRGDCRSLGQSQRPRVECSLLHLGGLPLMTGRITPVDTWERGAGCYSATFCYGGRMSYWENGLLVKIAPGDLFLNPRIGERLRLNYVSSVNFPVEHLSLLRVLRVMHADDVSLDLERPYLFTADPPQGCALGHAGLVAFCAYVDQLLLGGRHLPAALALDDQLHRLVALSFVQMSGSLEKLQRHWSIRRNRWTGSLDDLIDYIRSHAHLPLTLTDLQEQSRYSARHLQTLFRERFDCTPMQFVRRQRLELALRKLEAAGAGVTVTRIARDCGYRHVSNFSADFHRQFGLLPSQVLRGVPSL